MKNLFKLISIFKKYAYDENYFILPSTQKKLTFIPDVISYFEELGISQNEVKQKLL